ncbi:hypothetical protein E2542_SST02421 [Spatholobus suberectus]|nr:hypothetical protein E2542_SST02421 [Spatholobus suberectus]
MNQKGEKKIKKGREEHGTLDHELISVPTRESFEAKGKETEELHHRFKELEQEWQAFKESKPATASHKRAAPSNKSIQKPHKYSPRELMFNLQQEFPSPADAWKNVTRTSDMAVQEILQERREAIKSGKLKGRRLFQSTVEGDESATVSNHEVRSMSFYNSEDESSESEGVHDYCTRGFSYSSSSSSSCLVGADNDKDMEVVAHLAATIAEMRVASTGRRGNGRIMRYAVLLGGVAIILLVIAMCMSLARSSRGDGNVILVPT